MLKIYKSKMYQIQIIKDEVLTRKLPQIDIQHEFMKCKTQIPPVV